MNVVDSQRTFNKFALFLPRKLTENFSAVTSEVTAKLSVEQLLSAFEIHTTWFACAPGEQLCIISDPVDY